MAIVPRTGRRISPAGPVGGGGGPLYDAGLQALESASGNLAGELAQRDLRLREAHESAEIASRSANYALQLDDLTRRASEFKISDPSDQSFRMASADEQEQFFQGEISKLESEYGTWEKGLYGRKVSPESKTRLHNAMVQETAQQIGRFRQVQQARRLQEIGDKMQTAIDAAVQTNSEALLHEALEDPTEAGVITEATRDRLIAEFPMNVRIEQLRRRAGQDPDGVLTEAMAAQANEGATLQQRARLREVEDLARGIRYNNAKTLDASMHAMREDALKQAHEIGPEEFQDRLLQTVGITEEQKAYLMGVYVEAARLYQHTGSDPWTTTQNHESLAQTIRDVRNGKIKSYDEIDAIWLEGGKPNWSMNEWRGATNIFEDRNKPRDGKAYSPNHPAAELYFNKLDDMLKNEEIDAPTYVTKRFLLENGLSDPQVWRNTDKMEAVWEGLTKDVKEEKAKGFLSAVRSQVGSGLPGAALSPFSLASEASVSPTESPVGAGIAGNLGNLATRITDDSEYEALPSGTYFIGPDGEARVKP